jgi:CheY-like chemotaxis protein
MRLGPQALCAYRQLHQRITAGLLPPGTKLPPQADLAPALGVSLLTLRQALDQLEQEGLIASEHGRGTFVRTPTLPTVLILEDDAVQRTLLSAHVEATGYPVIAISSPQGGLQALEQTPTIALALSDLRMPTATDGLGFIGTVHQRWPALPLVAVTAYPDDLTPLQGRPEHPVLILTKPVVASQIARVLRLTLDPLGRHRDRHIMSTAP